MQCNLIAVYTSQLVNTFFPDTGIFKRVTQSMKLDIAARNYSPQYMVILKAILFAKNTFCQYNINESLKYNCISPLLITCLLFYF